MGATILPQCQYNLSICKDLYNTYTYTYIHACTPLFSITHAHTHSLTHSLTRTLTQSIILIHDLSLYHSIFFENLYFFIASPLTLLRSRTPPLYFLTYPTILLDLSLEDCVSPQIIHTASGSCLANGTIYQPNTSLPASCVNISSIPNADLLPPGNNTVVWNVENIANASGNVSLVNASCVSYIDVIDREAPVIGNEIF